jgi:hypothetical protein
VDQGLVEDRVRRHPGGGETAGVAGDRAQHARGAQPAVVEQRAGGLPVRGEAPVEPDLQQDACGAGGVDGPVGVGQRERHRLLAEHGLARPCRGHHQVGVEAGGRRDHHRVDGRVRERLRRIGAGAVRAEALRDPGRRVRHGHEPRSRDPARQRTAVERPHPAGPDQGHPDLVHPLLLEPRTF